MRTLEEARGKGRDDYPIRAMWNSLLAGIVFQHTSVESLRRELSRNGQLRRLCGFKLTSAKKQVPPAWVYTRFINLLMLHSDKVEEIFLKVSWILSAELPDFGKSLAIDGKYAQPCQSGITKDQYYEIYNSFRAELYQK